jgi:hypothetical protein
VLLKQLDRHIWRGTFLGINGRIRVIPNFNARRVQFFNRLDTFKNIIRFFRRRISVEVREEPTRAILISIDRAFIGGHVILSVLGDVDVIVSENRFGRFCGADGAGLLCDMRNGERRIRTFRGVGRTDGSHR